MKVVAVVSPKGGVGKTTTALSLCQSAASYGLKTLLIDYDNQANATASLVALDSTLNCTNSFDLVESTSAITPMTVTDKLDLLPAANKLTELDGKDFELFFRLRERIRDQFSSRYDLVVIDTPGHLGQRVISAMASADAMYSPIELTKYSLQALEPMVDLQRRVQSRFNPTLLFLGLLPNRVGNISVDTGLPIITQEREVYEILSNLFPILGMIAQRRGIKDTLSVGGTVQDISADASGKRAQEELNHFADVVLEKLGLRSK